MHNENWDDLRVFLALCRHGIAIDAGRSLEINHTTVARRIRALEASLSTRLFDTSRNCYEMTQAAGNRQTARLSNRSKGSADASRHLWLTGIPERA